MTSAIDSARTISYSVATAREEDGQGVFDLLRPEQNADGKGVCSTVDRLNAAAASDAVKTAACIPHNSTTGSSAGASCVEHIGLLDQLRDEEGASVLLLRQLAHERNNILGLIEGVSKQQYRFRCYLCLERVPLSLLVLNDLCRHSICRVCFSKVILEQATENTLVERSSVDASNVIHPTADGSTVEISTTASAARATRTSSNVFVRFNRMLRPVVRATKRPQNEHVSSAKTVYACLACSRRNLFDGKPSNASSFRKNAPSVLAILSPGIEEENGRDVGYRVHLLDNA